MRELKVGDEVMYPYAWPGPDLLLAKVLEIREDTEQVYLEDIDQDVGAKFWAPKRVLFTRR